MAIQVDEEKLNGLLKHSAEQSCPVNANGEMISCTEKDCAKCWKNHLKVETERG